MEIRLYAEILQRRKWVIVLTTIIAVTVVGVGSWLMTPTYSASTMVRVAQVQDSSIDYFDLNYSVRLMNTYAHLLRSGAFLGEVIQRLDLNILPEELTKRIKVEPLVDTELLKITVQSPDPRQAMEIANTLGTLLIEQGQKVYSGQGKTPREMLQQQLTIVEENLREDRALLQSLLNDNTGQHQVERIQDLNTRIRSLEETYAMLLHEHNRAQVGEEMRANSISVVEPAITPNAPSKPRIKLNITLGALVGLAGGIGLAFLLENLDPTLHSRHESEAVAKDPVLGSIDSFQAQLAEREAAVGGLRAQLSENEGEVEGLRAQMIERENTIDRFREQLAEWGAAVRGLKAQLSEKERELEALRAQMIEREGTIDSLQVELAEREAAVGDLRAQLSERERELEALRAQMIEREGTIDSLQVELAEREAAVGELRAQLRRSRRWVTVLDLDVRSSAGEAYQILRTGFLSLSSRIPKKMLLITSVEPGVGKSRLLANLAAGMAQAGQRVVVVDSDFRHPSLHQVFDLSNELGLSDIIVDRSRVDTALQETKIEGLRVLTSGPLPPNPVELLGSPKMQELIWELAVEADMVLLDSPPILSVADATVLAPIVDGVLLVVAREEATGRSVQTALQEMDEVGAKALGLVFSKAKAPDGDFG